MVNPKWWIFYSWRRNDSFAARKELLGDLGHFGVPRGLVGSVSKSSLRKLTRCDRSWKTTGKHITCFMVICFHIFPSKDGPNPCSRIVRKAMNINMAIFPKKPFGNRRFGGMFHGSLSLNMVVALPGNMLVFHCLRSQKGSIIREFSYAFNIL